MVRILLALAAAFVLARPVFAEELPVVPDDTMTPGVVASTDPADVCGRVDGRTYSQRHRHTSRKLKEELYAAYQVDRAGRDFEIDHRVPLCLGGADVRENLWPELGWQHPSYHDKDRLEAKICRLVCRSRTLTLEEGQAIFLGDWIAGFKQMYGQPPD